MSSSRILALGDSYMSAEVFAQAFLAKGFEVDTATVTIADATWDTSSIREFEGDPKETAELIAGYEVVAFHGAPFSSEVLGSSSELKFLACARGGPVNVDIAAAKSAGVRVTTTPGKNAEAVADLTIGCLISLARNLPAAIRDVEERVANGLQVAESNFEGARWFGREIQSLRVGLIGYGNVARLVSARAQALGASVVAYDPFVSVEQVTDARLVTSLEELLATVDVLSIHARATPQNTHMIGAKQLGLLPPGSIVINTARESFVDETALLSALRSGHISGAAADVNETNGPWRELVAEPNFTLTPHLGGATVETLRRGAEMAVAEVQRYLAGEPLRWER